MFGKTFDLFSVFGFKIRIDLSWFIIAVLVTWSLAASVFPGFVEGLAPTAYWVMGAAGALGLFASVVAHELSHATVARRYGVEMKGITLFIFGGVAEMTDEPPNPRAEFWVAIAGPIASVVIGAAFLALWALSLPRPVQSVVGYLGLINIVLALFNMIPAFPLDGGRILRSALWHWGGSLRRATRTTTRIGAGFGVALIAFGILRLILWEDFVGGMWTALIGMFVRSAAQMSYQQLLLRRVLEGEPVSRFMNPEPVTVPPQIPVEELVEEYVYRYHFKMFPVVGDRGLEGCVTTRQIKELPRERWANTPVRELVKGCSAENSIAPDADALSALSTMSQNRVSRLLVVEEGTLRGVLALKDLLDFFSMKIELEG